jgi:hypothetical protein
VWNSRRLNNSAPLAGCLRSSQPATGSPQRRRSFSICRNLPNALVWTGESERRNHVDGEFADVLGRLTRAVGKGSVRHGVSILVEGPAGRGA